MPKAAASDLATIRDQLRADPRAVTGQIIAKGGPLGDPRPMKLTGGGCWGIHVPFDGAATITGLKLDMAGVSVTVPQRVREVAGIAYAFVRDVDGLVAVAAEPEPEKPASKDKSPP